MALSYQRCASSVSPIFQQVIARKIQSKALPPALFRTDVSRAALADARSPERNWATPSVFQRLAFFGDTTRAVLVSFTARSGSRSLGSEAVARNHARPFAAI